MQKVREHTGDVPGWTIDYEADAAYIKLSDDPVHSTVSHGVINVDLDEKGNAVGIELLTLQPGRPYWHGGDD